ncbi:TonB-dependent receptor [Sphingomonas sp. PB4P5]|uniref:TonB-dependent receptor n=1 Tax=Parasphingomonas puruogangriensis TaxID=3096155 RepID=UPI002FC60671
MQQRIGLLGAAALLVPAVAAAAPPGGVRVSLPLQPLAQSLQAIAQRFGIELLFSPDMLAGRTAPAVSGRFDAARALNLVLAGSGLTFRRTAEGSYVVVKTAIAAEAAPEAIPEILVIGRRTQNADIRRTDNDVRPYQVVTRQQIAASHVATVEELAAKRLPANAQGATLSQQGAAAYGETASSINLFGLGTAQTLILVDGRRLPQMANEIVGFLQSDVNAISPEAIDRVEAITATAGGIYGPGANAGVVNLVLRRDYRGASIAVTNGVTARGDAPYRRVDARLGFTPDHGRTEVMLGLSASDFAGLAAGERDYLARANARTFANDPSYIASYAVPASSSLNVVSQDGRPLTFKPSYGGAALGSPYSYAAPADGRSASALAQELTKHAGMLDTTPSANAGGGGASLLSGRRTRSIIASVRHRSGPIELFADFLRLTNKGHAVVSYANVGTILAADDPGNPFTQAVTVYSADPDLRHDYDFRDDVTRSTGGVILDLPRRWRASADYSFGSARRSLDGRGRYFTLPGLISYFSQRDASGKPRNPLGDYSAYTGSFDGLFGPDSRTFEQTNRFSDATLRVAGPLVRLEGGDLTATLLAEQRAEHVAGGIATQSSALLADIGPTPLPEFSQGTQSFYGELRAPLFSEHSDRRFLRGLELQLAVRHDRSNTRAPLDTVAGAGTRTVRVAGTVYTAGLKVSPVAGVMLRGSVSTGEQPLTVLGLSRRVTSSLSLLPDPKRGNQRSLYSFDQILGGPLHPVPERARSISAGIVVQPALMGRLRLSLDYIHITNERESVNSLAGNSDFFIANEELYPDRVIRLPLTPADIALGYTGGRIAVVDTGSLQTGSTTIDTLNGRLDLNIPTARAGAVDLSAAATWQPYFKQVIGFGMPDRDYRNAIDGALAIRGNAGARWSKGPWSLSVDGQFTGSYRITSALEYLRDLFDEDVRLQGGDRVPAQASVDMGVEYRMVLPGQGLMGRARTLDIRFGIQDVLDQRPATVVNAPGDYSSYADPRRRRFELTIGAGF